MTRNLISPSKEAGFTLLEVLVAIGLLAFLSLGIYQVTTSVWSTNSRLSAEGADSTAIILALQSVRTDLSSIYTPFLGAIPPKPDVNLDSTFWSPPVRSDGMRRSRFKGEAQKVSFIANNHRRVEADAPESDFQKITLEVERDKNGTYTLYRSIDWDAFRYEDDRTKKPERVPLIENLSSAKFTFYRISDKTYQDSWDSEGIYTKEENRFPNLIKLKIEAPDPTNNANPLAWEIVVRPNLNLNYLDANQRNLLKQRMD